MRIGETARWSFGVMRMRDFILLPVFALVMLCAQSHAIAQPDAVYSKSSKFRIPFQFDAEELTRIGAVQVELHVSTDRGQTWQVSDRVAPSAQKFPFQANGNGEYWFSVRTIDLNQRPHPDGPLQPGLVVVVDDIPPTLSLDAVADPQGGARLIWTASDPNLSAGSLRIEYLDDAIAAWQPVSVTPAASGSMRWSPPGGATSVMLRASISDQAGNQVSVNAELRGSTSPASRRDSFSPNHESHPSPSNDVPDFREPVANRTYPELHDSGKGFGSPNMPQMRSDQWSNGVAITPNSPRHPLPVHSVSSGEATANSAMGTPPIRVAQRPGDPLTLPVPAPVGSSDNYSPTIIEGPQNIYGYNNTAPVYPDARRVNARSFRIAYALEDVGPSGVASVDLYITENDGQKWFHYGSDPDRSSPFEVTVRQDGAYGFSVRVRSGVGLVTPPPQPGEAPEIRIVVDQTRPRLTMQPPKQTVTSGVHQVLIEWTLQDEALAERPVSLYSGPSPNGPWEPITEQIENTGQYAWSMHTGLRGQLYVKLIGKDSAGNSSEAISQRPITIDMSRPSVKILNVEPLR